MNFDPTLDASSPVISPLKETWPTAWIWFPGQLAAHLHTLVSQRAFRRCAHIGYPGTFYHAEHYVFLRRSVTLVAPLAVRWSAPLGRTRVRINGSEGDITRSQALLPVGKVDLLVSIDMTESLPCFLFDAGPAASGPAWEASLDGSHWVEVEHGTSPAAPGRLPDLNLDGVLPLPPHSVVELLHGRQEKTGYTLEAGGRLLVDFWHDELGELVIDAQGGGTLQVSVGETMAETRDPDPALAEQYPLPHVQLDPRGSTHRLPERLVRYVLLQAGAPCKITLLRLDARIYPVKYRGWFECSDGRLTEIWKAGAATLHSNLHDGVILDGLKRDALVWLFDETIDFEAVQCVFFDHEVVRNTILCLCPPPHLRPEDVGIPDNLLYFVIGFYQDFLASGDPSFPRRYRRNIRQALDLLAGLQDEKGFIPAHAFSKGVGGFLGEYFPDWQGKADNGQKRPTDLDGDGTPTYAQIILMRTFEVGAQFAELWSEPALARDYAQRAAQLRRSIPAEFWDAQRGGFINGLRRDGTPDQRLSPVAQSWALLCDLVAAADVPRLVDGVLADPSLRAGNVSMSAYWEYLAYIKTGRFDLVLQNIRHYWGWMLDCGFTRFMEDIDPRDSEADRLSFYTRPYAMSLNHGWSGSVAVSCLMRGVLGLQILAPGYSLVQLSPNWTTFEWVTCKLPTPHGAIELHHRQSEGALLTLPSGVTARVQLASGPREFSGPGQFLL